MNCNFKVFTILFVLSTARLSAQTTTERTPEKPNINVSAIAEREVVPDEIYLGITLAERFEGREKIDIDMQEKQMIEKLKSCGVNIDDLALSAADEIYKKAKVLHNNKPPSKILK